VSADHLEALDETQFGTHWSRLCIRISQWGKVTFWTDAPAHVLGPPILACTDHCKCSVNMTNRLMFLWENSRIAWCALFPHDAERETDRQRTSFIMFKSWIHPSRLWSIFYICCVTADTSSLIWVNYSRRSLEASPVGFIGRETQFRALSHHKNFSCTFSSRRQPGINCKVNVS
jgi:hypothetical protein